MTPSCQSTAYAKFFYDSYDNTSNPGVTFPPGCAAPNGSYASDPIGHMTAERFVGNSSAGTGWRCYGYDQRGQLDQSGLSVTADGQTTTQTVNLLYNDGGEVTGVVYPDGETLTSQYDSNGRFQSSYFGIPSTPDPVPFLVGSTSYTTWGQLSGESVGGSGPKGGGPTSSVYSTALSYDGIQRLQSSSATRGSQTFWSQTRTYDNVGNVLGLTTIVPTQGGGTKRQVEAFCYDALSRVVWAGNNGTPTGGDHCMTPPSGTTLSFYHQSYSYDDLDRITNGEGGTVSYTDSNHAHAATRLGSVPNLYANYDAMGNMTCRNIDTTTAHTCANGSATGASLSYDVEGRLDSWTAPGGTTANDKFLYDNEGNRVLQRSSMTTGSTTTVTDTITFDGYTETTISGGTTTTIKYYSANGQRVALKSNGTLSYLLSDSLSSTTVALTSDGSGQAVQLYLPYGSVRFSWGTMPTTYNFTGQRLDSQTGLLYYNFRYYDPISGRFVRADTVETNAQGMDGYAYVGDSPETKGDPTGHDPDPLTIFLTAMLLAAMTPAVVIGGAGVAILALTSIIIANAPSGSNGSGYSPTGPQPEPVPTPEAAPSTDANGAMCRTVRCFDLGKAEGYSYTVRNPDGKEHPYVAHTLRHVGVEDTVARAATIGSNSQGGYSSFSVFNDLTTAEWAVQYLLDHTDLTQIAPGTDKRLSIDTGMDIGWGYQRNGNNPNKVTGITSVTVRIYIDTGGVPHVMDAFPTLGPYNPPTNPVSHGPGNIR